jgi:hypothetical protein
MMRGDEERNLSGRDSVVGSSGRAEFYIEKT